MANELFEFDLYKLQVQEPSQKAFDFYGNAVSGDLDIVKVLAEASNARHDHDKRARRATYKWAIRQFAILNPNENANRQVLGFTVARSTVSQQGRIVADDKIVEGESMINPPLAVESNAWIFLDRHLVAVEVNASIMNTRGWLKALYRILDQASRRLNFTSQIRFEERPEDHAIMKEFESFKKLTKLRVRIKLPNPEFDDETKKLMDDMKAGRIQEFLQEMVNPDGLNQEKGAPPYATARTAEFGYKKGDVRMEGYGMDGKRKKVVTGERPARGQVDNLRAFSRDPKVMKPQSDEAMLMVKKVKEEIERIAPRRKDANS